MEFHFDYHTIASIVRTATESKTRISELVLKQQADQLERSEEDIFRQMENNYQVMTACIDPGSEKDIRSTSGLTGGSAYKMRQVSESGKSLTSDVECALPRFGCIRAQCRNGSNRRCPDSWKLWNPSSRCPHNGSRKGLFP